MSQETAKQLEDQVPETTPQTKTPSLKLVPETTTLDWGTVNSPVFPTQMRTVTATTRDAVKKSVGQSVGQKTTPNKSTAKQPNVSSLNWGGNTPMFATKERFDY
jgi:hypothetical protein